MKFTKKEKERRKIGLVVSISVHIAIVLLCLAIFVFTRDTPESPKIAFDDDLTNQELPNNNTNTPQDKPTVAPISEDVDNEIKKNNQNLPITEGPKVKEQHIEEEIDTETNLGKHEEGFQKSNENPIVQNPIVQNPTVQNPTEVMVEKPVQPEASPTNYAAPRSSRKSTTKSESISYGNNNLVATTRGFDNRSKSVKIYNASVLKVKGWHLNCNLNIKGPHVNRGNKVILLVEINDKGKIITLEVDLMGNTASPSIVNNYIASIRPQLQKCLRKDGTPAPISKGKIIFK